LGGAQETAEEFARRVGLPVGNPAYLRRALTHSSYLNENPMELEDNERLEFLGDAVLDMVVASWLYNYYPELEEGDLTRMRSAIVGTEQLAGFAQELQVGRALRLGRGENEAGGRLRRTVLCGAFEAIIAATYQDSGLEAVATFLDPLLTRAAGRIFDLRLDRDPKGRLQEWAQSHGLGVPHYRLHSISGPDHDRAFEYEVLVNGEPSGRGAGTSKQAATKAAAQAALDALGAG